MCAPRYRRLLLFAVSSLAVLGPTGLAAAACPSRPRPPCSPVAFTGSLGTHVSRCVRTPPACSAVRGPRGRPGVIGKTGGIGKIGATGRIGSTGATGAQGFQGATGDVGPAGTQGATGTQGAIGTAGSTGAAGTQGLQGVAGDVGAPGTNGATGTQGATGPQGTIGTAGTQGTAGANGATGATGPAGPGGAVGPAGPSGPQGDPGTGSTGATGAAGAAGPTGPTGPSGTSEFAEFFALMPGDNAATVAVGARVRFPQDGPKTGSITRLSDSTFQLATAGTYRVSFQVSIDEPGQLELQLNTVGLPYTVVGRATGTSQIVGEALVTTATLNAVIGVMSPAGNSTALTITPLAGGTAPVSASLIIQKLG